MSGVTSTRDRRQTVSLRAIGLKGWRGFMRLGQDVCDVVVLRQTGDEGREPPETARHKLSEAAAMHGDQLKIMAARGIAAAGRWNRADEAASVWSIVELRITRDGRLWVGLYERQSGSQTIWRVEFDEAWAPQTVRRIENRNPDDMD